MADNVEPDADQEAAIDAAWEKLEQEEPTDKPLPANKTLDELRTKWQKAKGARKTKH